MRKFEILPEHIKLLSKMRVGWDDAEFGAPEIDPKRPYGNSGVEQDILEILGVKELRDGVYEFELLGKKWLLKGEDKNNIYLEGKEEQEMLEYLRQLHKSTKTALQICLATLSFEPGYYVADDYDINWRKA